jgi:hypothetical protein
VDRAIQLLSLTSNSTALDIGAGKCEWLARISGRWGARGIGIEPAHLFAEDARQLHAPTIAAGRLQIIEAAAADFLAAHPDARFDAALCIGSSHALGGYTATLDALIAHVTPGGVLVLGEGYWKKKPEPDYLAVLGSDESELTPHARNIHAAIERGCTPLWCTTVTDDEWDEYEWAYSRNIEDFVRDHPDAPDAAAMLKRSRAWRATVINGGRDTLGFGIYVFRAPG